MTNAEATYLATHQDRLAQLWNTEGPHAVLQSLNSHDTEDLVRLLMLNIGARALAL